MMLSKNYRIALGLAIAMHLFLAVLLCSESKSERPVLSLEAKNDASLAQPLAADAPVQAIKAVTVDNQEIMETVNRLKQEKARQQTLEINRQKALAQQAEMAKNARIEEQRRLKEIKQEEEKIAVFRKKKLEEEQQNLKQLAQQKVVEEQKLAEMKQQQVQLQKQQLEALKLAEAKQKKDTELAKAREAALNAERTQAALNAEKAQAAVAKELLAKQQLAQATQASADATRAARLSGEVNKYKALIINAISQQWILPEHANSSMSSQFRIRLAPNGVVLDVTLTKSSGDAILDRSAQSAIYKASPLPVPNDTETFNIFRDISLTVRPESARG